MTIQKILTAHHSTGSYPLKIGQYLLNDEHFLQEHIQGKQALIVTNETVATWYLAPVEHALKNFEYQTLTLPDGEQYKTLAQVKKIWDLLAENHYHRDATLIALGGGVIGDMTGFAAACYHRGINFIQIPTTLLAQTDAAIGGKTAVDHPCGKNLIGAFHQPIAVIIDINTLSTLPDREYRAGMSEIIKAALIRDASFFNWLEQNIQQLLIKHPETTLYAIEHACQIKCDVVKEDEKEKGLRALLNLGHTFAHAIEQNLEYQHWLHGEAVALGILLAADLSVEKGWLNKEDRKRIRDIFIQIQMPTRLPSKIKCDTLLSTLWSDKKVVSNTLHFVILKGVGRAELRSEVNEQELRALLNKYQ